MHTYSQFPHRMLVTMLPCQCAYTGLRGTFLECTVPLCHYQPLYLLQPGPVQWIRVRRLITSMSWLAAIHPASVGECPGQPRAWYLRGLLVSRTPLHWQTRMYSDWLTANAP